MVLLSGPHVECAVTLVSTVAVLGHAELVRPRSLADDSPCHTPDVVGKKAASVVVVAMSELAHDADARIAVCSVTGHGWLPFELETTWW